MKPEDRALLAAVIAVTVLATAGAAYFLVFAGNVPVTLPVPAGTAFSANVTEHWAAHFTVGSTGGSVVGAWTAYRGFGAIRLIVVNGTVSKPWPPPVYYCPLLYAWEQSNGTADTPLGPGSYTAYWSTGYCSSASEIVVTRTIQVVPPQAA